jgi:hypothetical protein
MLCGPKRHAIFALAYEVGMMMGDTEMTTETAGPFLQSIVRGLLKTGEIGSRCGLCDAPVPEWCSEDAPTKFRTMEEAEPHLRESQLKNLEALVRMKSYRETHRN